MAVVRDAKSDLECGLFIHKPVSNILTMIASNLLLLLLGAIAAAVQPVQAEHGHRSIRVRAGQCIQDAINRANPGDAIYVGPGKYAEYLTIRKDGIRLIGKYATLVPPGGPPIKPNDCVGLAGNETTAGICIIGKGVKLEKFEREHRKVSKVDRYVNNVSVEGFHVKDFDGLNIAVVGARGTELKYNMLENGGLYGALTVGSIGTRIHDNRVKSSGLFFIGICMDDTSDVKVSKNTISDYGIALCVQTNGAKVSNNHVTNCCVGAFVDPGIDGAQITGNGSYSCYNWGSSRVKSADC